MNIIKICGLICLSTLLVTLSGCASGLTKFTDIGTGKTYYTSQSYTNYYAPIGPIRFNDVETGKTVTLLSYETEFVAKDDLPTRVRDKAFPAGK